MGVTRLGDRLLLMAYAHIGHDADVGADVTIANGAQLAGHVHIGAHANIGARAAIHQFVTVGPGAMIAAGAMVSGDVPPWTLVAGDRARVIGPNAVALRLRWGREGVDAMRRALRLVWPRSGGMGSLDGLPDLPPIHDLRTFLEADRRRPVCRRGRA
jgi:UDP-N-acetylglucosamine acyltransferase